MTSISLQSGSSYWLVVVAVSLLKLLLLKSYRSTDFEVHRNWLAITHSLPLDKWYYEKTSEWTLDYPPFFAYFEWILSHIAKFFDEGMLKIENLNYASSNTILFQKLSVIFVDLLLAYSVLRCSLSLSLFQGKRVGRPKKEKEASSVSTNESKRLNTLFVLIFLNGGLFIVDHIHFQYNGFLFGILLLSIAFCLERKYYTGAFTFAALLNFKHIFLYMAPAFGIYLLRRKVFPPKTKLQFKDIIISLSSFASIGILVLAASFGPFYQHIPQILSRLFPFQRGLSHAYWAPNIWALYNTLDWALKLVLKEGTSSVTSGLVGEATFAFLPNVLPKHTFVLTAILMLPALWKLWNSPSESNFIRGIVVTSWTSFMFGYHVHEKAILNVLVPFSLIAVEDPHLYFMTLVPGTISLFPLLFTPIEIALKAIIATFHFILTFNVLSSITFHWSELLYFAGFVGLFVIENFGGYLVPKLQFLPLMLVSDYTFLGNIYCYAIFYWKFYQSSNSSNKKIESPARQSLREETIKVSTTTIKVSIKKSSSKPDSPDKTPKIDSPVKKQPSTPGRKKSTRKVVTPPEPSTRVLRQRR